MIDLILLSFNAAVFAGGFYLGNKYGTYRNMWNSLRGKVKNSL